MSPNFARWRIRLGASALALAVLVGCLPSIVAHTGLRHWVVNRLLGNPRLKAHVGVASFSWFSPLWLEQVQIVDSEDAVRVHVARVEAAKSWPRIVAALPEAGSISLQRLELDLNAAGWRQLPLHPPRRRRNTSLLAIVKDAHVRVRPSAEAMPMIELDGLDVTVHVEPTAQGQILRVEPVQLLDQQPLTREMLDHGMRLVTPVLAQAAQMQGSVSLKLDKCEIPLMHEPENPSVEQMQIEGRLEFHDLSAGLKDPVLLMVSEVIARMLQRAVPTRMRIVENTELNFYCADGRVYHEGMAFVLPELSDELVILSSGSVGLDETLDVTVEIPLPLQALQDRPLLRKLAERPLRLHVTGTLNEPEVGAFENDRWLADLAGDVLDDALRGNSGEMLQQLFNEVGSGLEEASDATAPLAGVFEQLRQRREALRPRRDEDRDEDREESADGDGAEQDQSPRPRWPRLFRRRVKE